jgi:hypothetical protein
MYHSILLRMLQVAYYSFKLAGALLILLEVTFQGGQVCIVNAF